MLIVPSHRFPETRGQLIVASSVLTGVKPGREERFGKGRSSPSFFWVTRVCLKLLPVIVLIAGRIPGCYWESKENLALEPTNRKSFRPPLAESKERAASTRSTAPKVLKQTPPDQTNAENFYYIKQMQAKTPMVLVLKDGEEVHGVIEWYDRTCLKVNRTEGPNLLLYKSYIKYMYKAENA